MKIIPFEELYHSEFTLTDTISKPQNWYSRGSEYNSLDKPKVSHTFLWFKNCSGTLTDAAGAVLEIPRGALIYTAKGSRYVIRFHGTEPGVTDTVVIHFQLHGEDGEDIAPVPSAVICMKSTDAGLCAAMDSLAGEFRKNIICTPELKAVIYQIFAVVCRKSRRSGLTC